LIAVDTNILVYAQRMDSPFHAAAIRRMRDLVEGNLSWAIPWPCLHELIAVTTNRRVFEPPTTLDDALAFVSSLVRSPRLVLLSETPAHWQTLQSLATMGQTTGGRIHDARIAALCLEHGVRELWTADRDFGRFRGLTVVNPLIG
jgi:uncharacterized protein